MLGCFAVFETSWPGQNEEIIDGTGAFTLERQAWDESGKGSLQAEGQAHG